MQKTAKKDISFPTIVHESETPPPPFFAARRNSSSVWRPHQPTVRPSRRIRRTQPELIKRASKGRGPPSLPRSQFTDKGGRTEHIPSIVSVTASGELQGPAHGSGCVKMSPTLHIDLTVSAFCSHVRAFSSFHHCPWSYSQLRISTTVLPLTGDAQHHDSPRARPSCGKCQEESIWSLDERSMWNAGLWGYWL